MPETLVTGSMKFLWESVTPYHPHKSKQSLELTRSFHNSTLSTCGSPLLTELPFQLYVCLLAPWQGPFSSV